MGSTPGPPLNENYNIGVFADEDVVLLHGVSEYGMPALRALLRSLMIRSCSSAHCLPYISISSLQNKQD